MFEFLYATSTFLYCFLILLTAIFFLVIKVYKRHASLAIVLAINTIFELIFFNMRTHILDLPFDKEMVRFIWFNCFSIVAAIGCYSIFKLHELYKCAPKSEAKLVVTVYMFFSIFELMTYLDYSFVNTGILPVVYRFLIPSLGLLIAVKLIWRTMAVIHEYIFKIRKLEVENGSN